MTRYLALVIAAAVAPGAAQAPTALSQAQPGLWEVSGVPGAAGVTRQCIADLALLARFEHRARSCSTKLLKSAGSESDFDYSCGAAGFGHSEVTVITPRSLRISTQGISDGLPFNYVLQARRVGECQTAGRH